MRTTDNNYRIYTTQINFKGNENRPEIFKKLSEVENEKSALMLIRQQSDLINPVDTNGDYIIHAVAKKDFFETLKQMLQNPTRAGKMLELKGEGGKTPLAVAQSNRAARLMLQKGANPYALDDNRVPAGLNKFLPNEIRNGVQNAIEEKLSK